MDPVDIEPCSDLFAFLDASVGAQRARRLRLHLSGRGILLQHDGGPAVLCGVGSLFYNSPESSRIKCAHLIDFIIRMLRICFQIKEQTSKLG